MTLVYRAPKHLNNQIQPSPGPAQYQIVTHQQAYHHKSPPFSSNVHRMQSSSAKDGELGPGAYEVQNADAIRLNKVSSSCCSVFSSKIQRFKSNEKNVGNQNKISEGFNELLKKQREGEQVNVGKLKTLKDKKDQEKQWKLQHLPSIPNWQQSYGYKFDPSTNRMICNENPKILLAQNTTLLDTTVTGSFFFARNHHQIANPKPNHNWHSLKAQRSSPELVHQLEYPSATLYKFQNYNSIANNSKKHKAFISKEKHRYQKENQDFIGGNSAENKKQLLLRRNYQKQFKQYINKNDQKINQQTNQLQTKSKLKIQDINTLQKQKQCFFSKVPRFHNQSIEDTKALNQKKILTTETQKQHKYLNVKQPYSVGQVRFKKQSIHSIGPGSYLSEEMLTNYAKSATIKLTEKRFHQNTEINQIPGPGTYSINGNLAKQNSKNYLQIKNDRIEKHTFLKGCHESKIKKSKQNSLEILYQQYGRQMNYLNKIDQLTKKQPKSNISKDVKQVMKNDYSFAKLKNQIQAKLQNQIHEGQQKSNGKEQKLYLESNCKSRPTQQLKQQHLYEYEKPEARGEALGPGSFELAKSFQKKTFNITYD